MSEEEAEGQEVQEEAPPVRREVLSWKQKAIRTYEHRQVAREQQMAMMRSKNLDQFRDALGQLLGKEYEVTDTRVEIDGVTFVGHPGVGQGGCEIDVATVCPDCQGEQLQHIRTIGDIGAILCGAGEPHEDCPAKPHENVSTTELTPDQKFLEAFKTYLGSLFEEA
jgi:hypothetical protein